MWIKYQEVNEIRGHRYFSLINLTTGALVEINTHKGQKDDDLNVSIFVEYPGMNTRCIFRSTPVECIRVLDKLGNKFNAVEMNAWD